MSLTLPFSSNAVPVAVISSRNSVAAISSSVGSTTGASSSPPSVFSSLPSCTLGGGATYNAFFTATLGVTTDK